MSPSTKTTPTFSCTPPRPIDLLYCAKFLDAKLLRNEPPLNASRWPGHFGSIVSLNIQFALAYQKAFKDFFRANVDPTGVNGVRGLNLNLFNSALSEKDASGDRKAIHRIRQVADCAGLPYGRFIEFCLEFSGTRGTRHIARPNQLVAHDRANDLFDQQLDELICKEKPSLLHNYLAVNPNVQLPEFPSCLGVLGARDKNSPICSACRHFGNCGSLGVKLASVIAKIALDTGTPVMLMDRLKSEDAARHRITRAKKKLRKLTAIKTSYLKVDDDWTV